MLSGEDISRPSHNRKGDGLTITKFTTEPLFGVKVSELFGVLMLGFWPSSRMTTFR
jgi:hypothetical protein